MVEYDELHRLEHFQTTESSTGERTHIFGKNYGSWALEPSLEDEHWCQTTNAQLQSASPNRWQSPMQCNAIARTLWPSLSVLPVEIYILMRRQLVGRVTSSLTWSLIGIQPARDGNGQFGKTSSYSRLPLTKMMMMMNIFWEKTEAGVKGVNLWQTKCNL